jgi:Family of unknown function (DUF5318)
MANSSKTCPFDVSGRYIECSIRHQLGKGGVDGSRPLDPDRPEGDSLVLMSFRPETMRGAPSVPQVGGQVDYRLARNAVVSEFHKGRLSKLDVCDAQPELLRAATNCGQPTREDCPICAETKVVLVSYVFGSRLPASGRVVGSKSELAKLTRAGRDLACYVVEVCPACSWNHLARTFAVGGRRTERT